MTGGLRARKKAELRAAVEREGLRLFAANGFDATTVDAVAEACNISSTTVFRYFPVKEDIVFASVARAGDRLVELLARQPARAGPPSALYGALLELCEDYEHDRAGAMRANRVVEGSASLRARKAESQQRWERAVVAELSRRDTDEITLRFVAATGLSAFRIALELWLEDPGTDLRDLVATACDRLRTGFEPRAG